MDISYYVLALDYLFLANPCPLPFLAPASVVRSCVPGRGRTWIDGAVRMRPGLAESRPRDGAARTSAGVET